jgi:hypothetical protein
MPIEKKNIPLIVALSLPLLMIILIAVTIYLPSLFVKPTTDFVFMLGGNCCYNCPRLYAVRNGRLFRNDIVSELNDKQCAANTSSIRFYYYDIEKDVSREIDYAQAAQLVYDDSAISRDGFEIEDGHDSDFFGVGRNYDEKYIKKGAYSRRLNMPKPERWYDYAFIGWVKGAN